MRAPGLLLAAAVAFSIPALAQSPQPFRDCPTCPEMVAIPAGSFTMGSTSAETTAAGLPNEQAAREWPVHKVTIAKSFAAGRYELTVGEYAVFADETKRPAAANCTTWSEAQKKWGPVADATWRNPGYAQTDRFPVGCLTIDDARAYTAWLSIKTGQTYRVPSEAEWEYITRSKPKAAEPQAKNICSAANVSDLGRAEAHGGDASDPSRFFNCRDGYVYAAPVGMFPTNGYGLSDVIGNIWEWTEDCFIPTYEGAPADGTARRATDCQQLVVRGGGWYSRSWFARAAGRSREAPDYRSSTLGLRVVRDMP